MHDLPLTLPPPLHLLAPLLHPLPPLPPPPPPPAEVPPGRYMSQGLVRICPQGFYRAEYKQFDDPTAQVCVACNPGITTANAGAGFPYLCNVVAPGYGIANVTYVDGTLVVPALPAEASTAGYPTASLCGLGFYSSGGNCLQCPQRTVTTRLGALAAEECGECVEGHGCVPQVARCQYSNRQPGAMWSWVRPESV